MKQNTFSKLALGVTSLVLAIAQNSQASAFSLGNLVVVQSGTGSGSLGSASTAAFLKEFTTGGSLVQTINMPTAASGANAPLTLSGTATSEGFLTLSGDGQYLMMGGYGTAPGLASVTSTAGTNVSRVVGRIDMSGNVDTTTALTDAYYGSNIRSVTSTDGTSIWTGGNGGSGLGPTAGTRYTTFGSSTSVGSLHANSNMRVVNIFNGQLYVSSATGSFLGINQIGTGLPTTTGQTITVLPGLPTSGTHSPYDFWFKDASTLYVADDGTAANGGGIQKWALNAGTWSLQYVLTNATFIGVRGLAGTLDGGGNAVLYATTSATTANQLITVTDTGAGSTITSLATAPANTAFRGVEFLPIPEPGAQALLLLGSIAFLARRRR